MYIQGPYESDIDAVYTLYDSPKGLLRGGRGCQRPPKLGPYESGDPKNPPALSRSEKEGGRRPPKSSHLNIKVA